MKKNICVLILPLIVLSGLVFANRETKNETKQSPKPLSIADRKARLVDAKSSGSKWLIVRINGEEYMMQFSPKDFHQLNSLKVNDKIIVRSHSVGYSPNHPYLIVSGEYIERNSKILFKRDVSKNNRC